MKTNPLSIAFYALFFGLFLVPSSVLAQSVVCTAHTYRGGWAQVYSDGSLVAERVPQDFIAWQQKFRNDGEKIKSVAFSSRNNGWVIIYRYNGYRYWNIPSGLVARLREAQTKQEEILSVTIGPQDQWILITDKTYWVSPTSWFRAVQDIAKTGQLIRAEFDSSTCRVWVKSTDGNTTEWTTQIGR